MTDQSSGRKWSAVMDGSFTIPTAAGEQVAARAAFEDPRAATRLRLCCSECKREFGSVKVLPPIGLIVHVVVVGDEVQSADVREQSEAIGVELPPRSAPRRESFVLLTPPTSPVPLPTDPLVAHCRCVHGRRVLDREQLLRRARAKPGTWFVPIGQLPHL